MRSARFGTREALELAINEGSDLENDEDLSNEVSLFSDEEFIPANDDFSDDSDRDSDRCLRRPDNKNFSVFPCWCGY